MKIVTDTSVVIAVITNETHEAKIIQKTKNFKQADTAIKEYMKIPIQLYEVDLIAALNVAHQLDIYAYDAYFLVCANTLNLPLLTLDKNLARFGSEIGIKIEEV